MMHISLKRYWLFFLWPEIWNESNLANYEQFSQHLFFGFVREMEIYLILLQGIHLRLYDIFTNV